MSVDLAIHTPTGIVLKAAEVFKFPGGEVHLKDINHEIVSDNAVFTALVRGSNLDDLMAAALWSEVAASHGLRFVLMLPYLPAARADKGTPEGAYVYAQFINSMIQDASDQVITIDAHSDVMPRYIESLTNLPAVPLILRALEETGQRYDAVIAPDAGAVGRAGAVAEVLGVDLYECEKQRDFDTGKLLKYTAPDIPQSGRYLVVDDICDGGGTFMLLVDALDVSRLDLWVTHGIFSGNAPVLRGSYRSIYTTDSHPGHGRINCATTVIPTCTYMLDAMKKDYT